MTERRLMRVRLLQCR